MQEQQQQQQRGSMCMAAHFGVAASDCCKSDHSLNDAERAAQREIRGRLQLIEQPEGFWHVEGMVRD
jgi:hypothetical protein